MGQSHDKLKLLIIHIVSSCGHICHVVVILVLSRFISKSHLLVLNSGASRVLVQGGGLHDERLALFALLVCFANGRIVGLGTLLR